VRRTQCRTANGQRGQVVGLHVGGDRACLFRVAQQACQRLVEASRRGGEPGVRPVPFAGERGADVLAARGFSITSSRNPNNASPGAAWAAHRSAAATRPSIRALVRDTATPAAIALAAAGAELARGDFDDAASLPPALDGIAAVFGVPPVAYGEDGSDPELEAVRGRTLIDAAVAAGSSRSCSAPSPRPPA